MNVLLVYLLLLKASVTSFSGLASLPTVQADFVGKHHILTDSQLNTAVAAGRSGPGPAGIYLVNVGYLAAGVPGAIAGWLAVVTPAFLMLPVLRYFSRYAGDRRVRSAIQAVLLSSAGLLLSATIPLGHDGLKNWWTIAIAAATFVVLVFTRIETFWVVIASAGLGLMAAWTGM